MKWFRTGNTEACKEVGSMKKVLSRIIAAASAALISVVLFAESVFASAEPTFAEKMGQAGRNTVIGCENNNLTFI